MRRKMRRAGERIEISRKAREIPPRRRLRTAALFDFSEKQKINWEHASARKYEGDAFALLLGELRAKSRLLLRPRGAGAARRPRATSKGLMLTAPR
jgi:hypothetical protein